MVEYNRNILREQVGNKMDYQGNHVMSIQEKSLQDTSLNTSHITKPLLKCIEFTSENGKHSDLITISLNKKVIGHSSHQKLKIGIFLPTTLLTVATTIHKRTITLNNIFVKVVPEAKPDPPSSKLRTS